MLILHIITMILQPCGPLLNTCTIENSYGRAWCAIDVDPITRVYRDWDWCDVMSKYTIPGIVCVVNKSNFQISALV